MSGKAVTSALSIGGYSIPAIPTQSAAWRWRGLAAWRWRADGVGVAAWVWQGCHTLLLIHLRRPMRMSAPTDADVCADRCGCLRRPMRMSASTDADVCADRYEHPRRPTRMIKTDNKAPKKRCDITCHTAFYIYKYRLNGNVNSVILQEQGEPSMWLLYE